MRYVGDVTEPAQELRPIDPALLQQRYQVVTDGGGESTCCAQVERPPLHPRVDPRDAAAFLVELVPLALAGVVLVRSLRAR